MKSVASVRLKKILTATGIFIILIHIALGILIRLIPHSPFINTSIGRFYSSFFFLGPFFPEDKIQSSYHVYARYYQQKEHVWSAYKDVMYDPFQEYIQQPWAFHQIILRDHYRKSVDRIMHDKGNLETSADLKRLTASLQETLPIKQAPDSMEIVYLIRWFNVDNNTYRTDTLFQFTYQPQ